MIRFVPISSVLGVHSELLREFGGKPGLRDRGLLESALDRPRNLEAYEGASIFRLAAAYAFEIIKNHPFIDGNKRVAFFATDVFLRLNGWKLVVDADEAHRFLTGLLESGARDYDHLLPWVRRSLRRSTKRS